MSVDIYSTLISKIETILGNVSNVKQIVPHPLVGKINKYPAVIFFPADFDNEFETTSENFKIYKFKMYVVVGTEQKTMLSIFNTVLPHTVDAILAQFDSDWDFGAIGGHRSWIKIDSGMWSLGVEKEGLEASAEMDVSIKLLTNN